MRAKVNFSFKYTNLQNKNLNRFFRADVGRSCVLVASETDTVMFDCGLHMAHANDPKQRFPDFAMLNKEIEKGRLPPVKAVCITHFHLDHCGALPYFTERIGYTGPIFMTVTFLFLKTILCENHLSINFPHFFC